MADYNIDWAPLSNLGQIYDRAKQRATIAEAYPGSGGDLNLAQLAMANRRDTRDFDLRKTEIDRNQANADRAFTFQQQQAQEAARGFETREVDDGSGGKVLVRINKQTGETTRVPIAGAPETPNNPFAYGKQNEAQSKDTGYANRMFRAEGILRDPEIEKAALDPWEHTKGGLAKGSGLIGGTVGMIANSQLTPQYQKYDQAKRDFVNAVLRRESGAAIAESEFTNAEKQYFPQPGDTPERLAEKRRNRQDAIAGVAGGGGQSYKPPFTFAPSGAMVPTNNPVQGATPQPKAQQPQAATPDAWKNKDTITAARANQQQTLAEAQAVIAKNPAAREQVIQRLKAVGIDPSPLMGGVGASSGQAIY